MAYKYPLVGDLLKEMDGGGVLLTSNPGRATGTGPRASVVRPPLVANQAPTIMGSPRRPKK